MCLLGLLMMAPVAHAQLTEVRPGARVRIEAPDVDASQIVGTVVLRSGDVLRVRRSNTELLTIPASRIASIEVSRGKTHSRGARNGAIVGTAWGAVLGLVTIGGAKTCSGPADARMCGLAQPPDVAAWVGYSMVSGAVVGTIVGALVRSERWERLSVGGRTTMGFRDGSARVEVAFR